MYEPTKQEMDFYITLHEKYSRKYGVDVCVNLAQTEAESGFNPNAKSPVGAVGLKQFMPATFTEIAESLQFSEPNPCNPEQSIEGGTYYLKSLANHFLWCKEQTDMWDFALASYNWGYGNIIKMLRRNPIQTIQEALPHLPAETQGYIKHIAEFTSEWRQKLNIQEDETNVSPMTPKGFTT